MTNGKGVDLMTNSKDISPGKETTNGQLQRTNSRRKAQADEDLASAGFPKLSDTCSPSRATDPVQYDGESLDFGDEGENLI